MLPSPAQKKTLTPKPSDLLPPMTYADFEAALLALASGRQHRNLVPFLVSALRKQAPYLNGQALMFEILASGSCLADLPMAPAKH